MFWFSTPMADAIRRSMPFSKQDIAWKRFSKPSRTCKPQKPPPQNNRPKLRTAPPLVLLPPLWFKL